MMTRILRALGALLVLVAVVVGAPVVLWKIGSGLVPATTPTWSQVWESLFAQDTGDLFIGLLVIIGAIAWAVFSLCVVLELFARMVGRGRAWRIPGLKMPQSAASILISMIVSGTVMLGGSPASAQPVDLAQTAPAVSAAVAGPVNDFPLRMPGAVAPEKAVAVTGSTTSAQVQPQQQPQAAGPTWTVQRYDSLWSIAEQTLGDGKLYQQIADLNIGVVQPDGKTLRDANTPLEIGWQLLLPGGTTAAAAAAEPASGAYSVTVQAGQSLSQIAQTQMGDASMYSLLAEVNGIADPDQLLVGQVLQIPAATPAPAGWTEPAADPTDPVAVVDQAAVDQATVDAEAQAAQAAAEAQAAEAAARAAAALAQEQATADAQDLSVQSATVQSQMEAARAAAAAQAQDTADTQDQVVLAEVAAAAGAAPVTPVGQNPGNAGQTEVSAPDQSGSDLSIVLGIAGVGAALASAVGIGLVRTRRRKGRLRQVDEIPAPVSLPAARVERQLRERASAADVEWMDQALRCAAAVSAGRALEELPDVTCVWLSSEELQLQLAAPVPAAGPFVAEGDSWILGADVDLPADLDWTEQAAPFPTLASVGEADGETLLVDLERLGAVSLIGDEVRTADMMRHLAVEFAHNIWSDYLQVTLVGWGQDLVVLNPDRLLYAGSAGDVVSLLRGRVREAAKARAELDPTVLESRVADFGEQDPWVPQVLLIDAAGAGDEVSELAQLLESIAGSGRSAVAVVARSDSAQLPGGQVMSIDADGSLMLPAVFGAGLQVQAAGLSEEALARLVELFVGAGEFELPGPVSASEPWAAQMDAVGGLIPAALDEPADEPELEEVDDSELEEAVGQNQGAEVINLRAPASPAAVAALAAVLADDPTLDSELLEWNSFPDTVDAAAVVAAGEGAVKKGEIEPPKEWVGVPRIGVLGKPLMITRGQQPPDGPHRYREIALYLAFHKVVAAEKFAADLWHEAHQPTGNNRRGYVSRMRTWFGLDPEGNTYLAEGRNEPYRLTSRLLDLDLFRRLRKRADAYIGVGDLVAASADLVAALKLVRGPVMSDLPAKEPRTGRIPYAWLTTSDPAQVSMAPYVVLLASRLLVDLALDQADLDMARFAADVGYLVDPQEEGPRCDFMRIAHFAGDDATARGWVKNILEANGVEMIEDLENHQTFNAISAVFPYGVTG